MRVQAPLRPSEGHPSRRPVAPNYAMVWCLLFPKMAQNRPKSPKIVPRWSKFGPNWSEMVQNRYKMVENGRNWILGEFRKSAVFLGHFPFTAYRPQKKVFFPLKLKSAHRRKYSTNNQKFFFDQKKKKFGKFLEVARLGRITF